MERTASPLPYIERNDIAQELDIWPDKLAITGLLNAYGVPADIIASTILRFSHIDGNIFDPDVLRYGQYETRMEKGKKIPQITIDPIASLISNDGTAGESQLNETLRHELGHLVYDHSPVTLLERRLVQAKNKLQSPAKIIAIGALIKRMGWTRAAAAGLGIYLVSNAVTRHPAVNHTLYENKFCEEFARRFAHNHRADDFLTVSRPAALASITFEAQSSAVLEKSLQFDILLSRALTPRARSLLRGPAELAIRTLQRSMGNSAPDTTMDIAAHRP